MKPKPPNTERVTFICPRCQNKFTANVHKGDEICMCECGEYAVKVSCDE